MDTSIKGFSKTVTRRNAIAAGALAAAAAAASLAAPGAAHAAGFSGALQGIAQGSGDSDEASAQTATTAAGTPTVAECKSLFSQALDENGLTYQVIDESRLCISFIGGDVSPIDIYVSFDDEDTDGLRRVYFDSWSIGNVPAGKIAAGYEAANAANCQYRWTAFSVDSDNDVALSISGLVSRDTCGAECISLLDKAVNITNLAGEFFAGIVDGSSSASSSDGGSFTVGV